MEVETTPQGAKLKISVEDLKELMGFIVSQTPLVKKIFNKKDKRIAIFIGIRYEDIEEKNRLEHDVINPLYNFLDSEGLREVFRIEVLDQKRMQEILEGLGLNYVRIMEKYRQKWSLGETEVAKCIFAVFL